jgi:hypothetical protein
MEFGIVLVLVAAHKWDSLDTMHGCRGVRVGLRILVSCSIEQGAVVRRRRGAYQSSKTDLQMSASLRSGGSTRILLESGASRDWVKDCRATPWISSNSVSQLAFHPAVAGCRQSGGWKPAHIVHTEFL